jgi:DNA-binding transcriptional MocR family regulator
VYQAQNQRLGDQLGSLLRVLEQNKAAPSVQPKEQKPSKDSKTQDQQKTLAKGWVKMGSLLVNTADPAGAMAEVLFRLHEEAKSRLGRATDALKSYDELSSTNIPEAGLFYVQVRDGVPERIVVDLKQARRGTFNFSADFQLV